MTKTTEENLSQSKYAEHRNVTKGYISRMIKEGRLHLIKGKLNVEMSDAELDNKTNNDKAPNYWSEKAFGSCGRISWWCSYCIRVGSF